jgi:hypothetical protein
MSREWMGVNMNKAGMDKVPKDVVNEIVYQLSKNSGIDLYNYLVELLWFLSKRPKTGKTYAFFLKIRNFVPLSGQNGIFQNI